MQIRQALYHYILLAPWAVFLKYKTCPVSILLRTFFWLSTSLNGPSRPNPTALSSLLTLSCLLLSSFLHVLTTPQRHGLWRSVSSSYKPPPLFSLHLPMSHQSFAENRTVPKSCPHTVRPQMAFEECPRDSISFGSSIRQQREWTGPLLCPTLLCTLLSGPLFFLIHQRGASVSECPPGPRTCSCQALWNLEVLQMCEDCCMSVSAHTEAAKCLSSFHYLKKKIFIWRLKNLPTPFLAWKVRAIAVEKPGFESLCLPSSCLHSMSSPPLDSLDSRKEQIHCLISRLGNKAPRCWKGEPRRPDRQALKSIFSRLHYSSQTVVTKQKALVTVGEMGYVNAALYVA